MSEFSRNYDTQPMSKRQRARFEGARAVLHGLIDHHTIVEVSGDIADVEPQQLVLPIEPRQAGYNINGDYTSGSF